MFCQKSPVGARLLNLCLLGAPNAGKSSLLNLMTEKNVSAVSNKYNTTTEATMGVYTDMPSKTQLIFKDTPGVTRASTSPRSKNLVTKAWDQIEDSDRVIFVVDAAKRLNLEIKDALIRLNRRAQGFDAQMHLIS